MRYMKTAKDTANMGSMTNGGKRGLQRGEQYANYEERVKCGDYETYDNDEDCGTMTNMKEYGS